MLISVCTIETAGEIQQTEDGSVHLQVLLTKTLHIFVEDSSHSNLLYYHPQCLTEACVIALCCESKLALGCLENTYYIILQEQGKTILAEVCETIKRAGLSQMDIVNHHMHFSWETVETTTSLASPEELLKDLFRGSASEVIAPGRFGTGGIQDSSEPISPLESHWGLDMLADKSQIGDEVSTNTNHLIAD